MVVRLEHLQFDEDDDDAHGVGQVAHGEEGVVAREGDVGEEREHGKVDYHGFAHAHEHPGDEDFEVEAVAALPARVQFWGCY